MKKFHWMSVALVLLLALGGCGLGPETGSWSESMQGMAQSVEKLLPFLYDQKRFSDPKNKKYIQLHLKLLSENAGALSKHTGVGLSGNDPLFDVGLKGLKASLTRAMVSYNVESYDYSQNILQASVSYCNTCHSRTSMGPTLIGWDQFNKIPTPVEPIDQSKVLVATRQFPKAIETLENGVIDGKISSLDGQQEAVDRILLLSLKNLERPKAALASLKRMRAFMKPQLKNKMKKWKNSLEKIAVDKKKNFDRKTLLSRYQKQDYITATYQSMRIHKYLSLENESMWRGRAYHRLGNIYQDYPQLGFWNLPETYFETCITVTPGTKTAQQCYFSLEMRVSELLARPGMNPVIVADQGKLGRLKKKAFNKQSVSTQSSGRSSGRDW